MTSSTKFRSNSSFISYRSVATLNIIKWIIRLHDCYSKPVFSSIMLLLDTPFRVICSLPSKGINFLWSVAYNDDVLIWAKGSQLYIFSVSALLFLQNCVKVEKALGCPEHRCSLLTELPFIQSYFHVASARFAQINFKYYDKTCKFCWNISTLKYAGCFYNAFPLKLHQWVWKSPIINISLTFMRRRRQNCLPLKRTTRTAYGKDVWMLHGT